MSPPWLALVGAQEGSVEDSICAPSMHAPMAAYFLLIHLQGSYEQHLLVCHDLAAISSALTLIAKSGSSGEGACWGEALGSSSSSSSSGEDSDHEGSSPQASQLALQLCMVLVTSAAGRKVRNTVPNSSCISYNARGLVDAAKRC